MNAVSSTSASCPDCNAIETLLIDNIPDAIEFCGVAVHEGLEGGGLWKCTECHLRFREPALDAAQLGELYRQVDPSYWSGPASERGDFRSAREAILLHSHPGARILDVGCGDGSFLDSLGTPYGKFGLEINADALRRASQKGVTALGADLENITAPEMRFDVITAIDVIEHMKSPGAFVAKLASKLSPGGLLILSTGNADSWIWKLCGARYWYCALPEHIAFISPKWIECVCNRERLELVELSYFSHAQKSALKMTKQAISASLYIFMPSIYRTLKKWRDGAYGEKAKRLHQQPPGLDQATDHLLAVIRKSKNLTIS
ncbi:MAG: class I SAM-dependent methyltransferase [Pseudomonadota bacterium]